MRGREVASDAKTGCLRPPHHELIADGLVHAIGIVSALYGALVLIQTIAPNGRPIEILVVVAYSASLITMLSASAAYNLARESQRRALLRYFDSAAIFAMMAGTLTPFTALQLEGAWAAAATSLIWSLAIGGIALKVRHPCLFDRLSIWAYLTFGVTGLIIVSPLLYSMNSTTRIELVVGSMLYMLGLIFHLWERLHFQSAIWHAFVVVAAGIHYFAVLDGALLPIARVQMAGGQI
jgi:hemolysin III